jgi:DNA-binding response OmpR family regulator
MDVESKTLSVLIVEGDNLSRSALATLVRKLGFETHSARTVSEAREVICRKSPDIMILDLMLPDGNGTSLLAEVRAARKPIIVAIATAVTNRLKLHEITALEPDALFGKPIDVDDFKIWLLKQLSACADLSIYDMRTQTPTRRVSSPPTMLAC